MRVPRAVLDAIAAARAAGRVVESPAPAPPADCSEREFQRAVIALAQARGWLVFHCRAARTGKGGWLTPVAGDGAGFPDLVLVKPNGTDGDVLFVELKTQRGTLTAAQKRWVLALNAAHATVHVWRPRDWRLIDYTLS